MATVAKSSLFVHALASKWNTNWNGREKHQRSFDETYASTFHKLFYYYYIISMHSFSIHNLSVGNGVRNPVRDKH